MIRVGTKLRRVNCGPPDLTDGKVYEVVFASGLSPLGHYAFSVTDDTFCPYPSSSRYVKGFPGSVAEPFWEVVEGGTLNGMDKVFPEGETT